MAAKKKSIDTTALTDAKTTLAADSTMPQVSIPVAEPEKALEVTVPVPEEKPMPMKKSQVSFEGYRALLGSVRTVADLRKWYAALSRDLAGDPDKEGVKKAIDSASHTLRKAPQDARLDAIEKDWPGLLYQADSFLHHATGKERDFSASWSETAMNAIRASGDAVMVAANTTKELAKDSVKGISWTLYALSAIAALGVGAYAWSMGRRRA